MDKFFTKSTGNKLLKIFIDIFSANLSLYMTLQLRFWAEMGFVPDIVIHKALLLLPFWLIIVPVVFYVMHMYDMVWRYVGIREAGKCVAATTVCVFILFCIRNVMALTVRFSLTIILWIIFTVITLSLRFGYRFLVGLHMEIKNRKNGRQKRVMVIGAGNAGYTIISEIQRQDQLRNTRVVCIIDDNPAKKNKIICGARVVGGKQEIIRAATKYKVDEIYFAIPSLKDSGMKEFFDICKNTRCVLKTLPSVCQLIDCEAHVSMIRDIEIADLLGRPAVELDTSQISGFIGGKTVLVTGAGGSIGSELCRQIAKYSPDKIIMLDFSENGIFSMKNEFAEHFPKVCTEQVIASVCDRDRLNRTFEKFHPDIVFHAAAHKHVPLMEENPTEAVKNNIFGTLNLADAADSYGVSKFVMISTDKAVNPTNVMGATKRACEMIIQSYASRSETCFTAVRFGNVLGSSGSVVPTFKRQIEQGGPVTVTHPDSIRYFMTIPEAASLVLQAGTYAKGGDIFVLDMGKPVRILALAENMIRLSGLVPYRDIDIVFTGLRPGEKLREELLMNEEGLTRTLNSQIYVGKPVDFDKNRFFSQLMRLKDMAQKENGDVRAFLEDLIPTYKPYEEESGNEQGGFTQASPCYKYHGIPKTSCV